MKWSLRDVHDSDLQGVVRLVEVTRNDPTAMPVDLVELIASARTGAPGVVASVGTRLIGVATATIGGDRGWVRCVAVDPAWADEDVAVALLDALEDRLLRLGVNRLSALLTAGQVVEGAFASSGFQAVRGLVLHEKQLGLQPSEVSVLEEWGGERVPPGAWDDVAGMEAEKSLIDSRVVAPLADADLAREIGVKPPATVMLFGPPGTGKTTFARAIASRLAWPFVELLPSKLAGGDQGLAAELRRAFGEMARLDHVVVFIDEFDEIAPSRQDRPEMQGVVNELLKAIPPFRASPGRLLVCATNFVANIDPAVLRPGRFDLVLPIGPPDDVARLALWERATNGMRHEGVTLEPLVEATDGYTPGDVALAAQRAAAAAFDRSRRGEDRPFVTDDDLGAAVSRTPASVTAGMRDAFAQERSAFDRS